MNGKHILEQALQLKADERLRLVEGLIKSLDEPDASLSEIWADESERRLKAYRIGESVGIPMEDVFREEK